MSIIYRNSFLVLIALFLSACKIKQPERIEFIVPKSNAGKTWPDIFSNAKDISVTTLETGKIKVKISDVLNLKNPFAKGIKDSSMYVPVFAHIIHHPVFGDWLVDSGLDSSFYKDPHGNIKGMLRTLYTCKQNKGQDIGTQIADRHLQLKGIFFTHLHPDHITGVPALPQNIRYIAGKGEKATFVKPIGIRLFISDQLRNVPKIEELNFNNATNIAPLGQCMDVFGDGSFWAVLTPGHTIAHLSFVVNSNKGPILLTGDVSHTKVGWDKGIEPGGFTMNCPLNLKSLLQLKQFVKEYPQLKVVLGHESMVR